MKNITLSADESLIEAARKWARREQVTLNDQFRRWLSRYAQQANKALAYDELMHELRRKVTTGGRRFTQDEINKR